MANCKQWAGRVGLVVIPPLLLLISLEATCRGLGWGYPTSFFVPDKVGGKDVWRTNEFYGYRFFQPLMARSPAPVTIDRTRSPGIKRVAVLGESAAMGDPLIEFGLARALDKILNKPGEPQRYEVVNAAMTAISSPVIVDIADELSGKDFDFFVVYAGNNEVVGPYGPNTVFQRGLPGSWFAPWHVRWTRTRLASAAQAWRSASSPGQPWDGMAMFSDNRFPPGSPLTEGIYKAYEQNLKRIIDSAEKHGIETILCTVAVNLRDCPPFGSAHGRALMEEETAAWQTAFDSGRTAAAAERHTDAAQDFTQALRIDPDHAEANYLAAISTEKSGDAKKASRLYSRARDFDTLRVRTDSRMNEVIRSVAAKRGTKLVECDDVFGTAPGTESFVDHVHFTLEGVALLANAVAEQIDPGRERVDTETLSKRLGRNDWSKRKLSTIMLQRLESIPFAGQTGNSEQLAKWQSQRESLNETVNATGADRVLADFGDRQLDYPWDHEYAMQSLHHLAAVGAWSQAASLADRIRPQMRGASAANGLLAVVYARAKRPEDAADVLTSTGPPYGYFLIDAAFQLLGSLDDAEGKGIACTVVTRILQKAGEFPGKAALVQWLKENGT